MTELNFTIKNKIITYSGPNLVGENTNYIAKFHFDEEWAGHQKTARFVWGGKYYERVLENDACVIPMIPSGATLVIGVYSDDKLASSVATINCRNSIKAGSPTKIKPEWKLVERINIIDSADWELGVEAPIYSEEENEEIWYDIALHNIYYYRHLNGLYKFVFHTPLDISAAPIETSPTESFWVAQSISIYWEPTYDMYNQVSGFNWEPDANGQYPKYVSTICQFVCKDDSREETEIRPFIELYLKPQYNEAGERYYIYPTECWLEIYTMEDAEL